MNEGPTSRKRGEKWGTRLRMTHQGKLRLLAAAAWLIFRHHRNLFFQQFRSLGEREV
jgi:hypothetical protein